MAGVNKVILVGRLGKDPEIRTTNDGGKIVSFSIATSETWKDKMSGERRERTEWHNIVIFNDGIGKVAEQYLRKGSQVYLEGQLSTRKWTDKEGQTKYTTEVVLQKFRGELTMLDTKSDGGGMSGERDSESGGGYKSGGGKPASAYAGNAGSSGASRGGGFGGGNDDLDDEIPF